MVILISIKYLFFLFPDRALGRYYLTDVKVYLDDKRVYSFPSFADYNEIDKLVTEIYLPSVTLASKITLRKENTNRRDFRNYILSFCEIEAWGKD